MKTVLAELHEIINSLEEHGFVFEANETNKVFNRLAQIQPKGQPFSGVANAAIIGKLFSDISSKQTSLGNVPINSNAWNKSLQKIIGVNPDGIWGTGSQNALETFINKNPNNYTALIRDNLKPAEIKKPNKMPAPGTGDFTDR